MSATKITDFLAQTNTHDLLWEAWANSASAELVVHKVIEYDDEPGPFWVIAHRRTGRNIFGWKFQFTSKTAALKAVAALETLHDWSMFARPSRTGNVKFDGDWTALRNRVQEVLNEAKGQVYDD